MKKPNKTVLIRKELKALIVEKQKSCTTEKEKNRVLNEARMEINKKYGKGWREGSMKEAKYQEPSIYDDHQYGEHWMD